MKKVRLDQLLVQRGLVESRTKAQALIMSGAVRIGETTHTKAGELVAPDVAVEVAATMPYVSRGGYKLAHALDAFGLAPAGLTALDAGASTGGFSDVLLQRGAARLYAIDVGYGILDWKVRSDPRVIVLDRTNIRYLDALPLAGDRGQGTGDRGQGTGNGDTELTTSAQPPVAVLADCAVIDTSFISLKLVLPAVQRLVCAEAWIVALIKPQFEAGQDHVGKGGVVRDPVVHAAVLRDILAFALQNAMTPHGLVRSPLTGPAGNIEFLAWLNGPGPALDVEGAIGAALAHEHNQT